MCFKSPLVLFCSLLLVGLLVTNSDAQCRGGSCQRSFSTADQDIEIQQRQQQIDALEQRINQLSVILNQLETSKNLVRSTPDSRFRVASDTILEDSIVQIGKSDQPARVQRIQFIEPVQQQPPVTVQAPTTRVQTGVQPQIRTGSRWSRR